MMGQQTLTGDDADLEDMLGATSPDTMITCPECDELLLRSERFDHEHDTFETKDLGRPESEQDDDADEEDEPEQVGSYYEVTLEYTVSYRFRVPAYSEHEAKDIAEQWQLDARPSDSYQVHTETREGTSIMSTDTPDDWDPYGSELLHEALERASENSTASDDLDNGDNS